MFRRKEDEENASQPQQSTNPASSQPLVQPTAAKPATPSFGSFGSNPAPVSAESAEPKKPVTAPLTTQQVGLSSSNANAASNIPAPKPLAPAAAPQQVQQQQQQQAPAQNSPFAPSYNKVPAPTQAPAAIPAATNYAAAPAKLDGIEAERRLTVGYGITLTGEVSDCDRLVIYGKVNAKLANVKFLQISDSGKFNGSATIDQAEISGIFEGELKVANNITITSTGRVNGKITYGSIEIRPGGKFTGEIIEDSSATNQQSGQSSSSEGGKDYYGLSGNRSGGTSEAA